MEYVAYYRVSTARQGSSGLGLDAQKTAIQNHLKEITALKEFVDIETGTSKGNERKGLKAALNYCRDHKTTLVIAKLDRLSRNLSFISQLMESQVEFVVCDMVHANRFTIQIFAALAEQEARFISERTKAALAELKRKGKKLGTPENLTLEARKKGLIIRQEKAISNENNLKAKLLIDNLLEKGYSYNKIAHKLNEHGYKTSKGCLFNRIQVMRLSHKS